MVIFSCYISPNIGITKFEEILKQIEYEIKRLNPHNLIICGDFNTKSTVWESPYTCRRGRIFEEWTITNNFILVNKGSAPTSTRQQGDSIVDTTWANPRSATFIHNWRVNEKALTYSDHNYIKYSIG